MSPAGQPRTRTQHSEKPLFCRLFFQSASQRRAARRTSNRAKLTPELTPAPAFTKRIIQPLESRCAESDRVRFSNRALIASQGQPCARGSVEVRRLYQSIGLRSYPLPSEGFLSRRLALPTRKKASPDRRRNPRSTGKGLGTSNDPPIRTRNPDSATTHTKRKHWWAWTDLNSRLHPYRL
jgi:hypothetical protein